MKPTDVFYSGNEAIALALVKAQTALVVGYPGTPSTEIIQTLQKNPPSIYPPSSVKSSSPQPTTVKPSCQAHWSVNEKVAFEMALGAALSGVRAAVVMKHVGLNVAADPLMTSSYAGVNGGFVIITADDPNMYSSQNEQDNRHYALFAKLPMLEPSDGNEAFLFTQLAFIISEKFNTPVILRLTMRVCHSYGTVDTTQDPEPLLPAAFSYPPKETKSFFDKTDPRTVMLPSIGRKRHSLVEKRLPLLEQFSTLLPINHFTPGTGSTLLITAGVPYHYILESFAKAPILKLGMPYPLPVQLIRDHAESFEHIITVEELDPFIERELIVSGIPYSKIRKRARSFYLGELSPERTADLVLHNSEETERLRENPAALPNPPQMCSGCPHLTIANLLRELDLTVSGDIGCYTLAALEPFKSLHTVIDMGASIPMMLGMQLGSRALEQTHPRKNAAANIAVIGDSTFLHSGITGLLEASHLAPNGVICLLDNRTTAMTGQQPHAGAPSTLSTHAHAPQPNIDYIKLAQIIGIPHTHKCDPYDLKASRKTLHQALAEPGISFVVFERACALIKPPPIRPLRSPEKIASKNQSSRSKTQSPLTTPITVTHPQQPSDQRQVSPPLFSPSSPPPKRLNGVAEVQSNCVKCGECLRVGCPSITFSQALGRPTIDPTSCIGCGICLDVCDFNALTEKREHNLFDLLKLAPTTES